jgi:hypothetical protein
MKSALAKGVEGVFTLGRLNSFSADLKHKAKIFAGAEKYTF